MISLINANAFHFFSIKSLKSLLNLNLKLKTKWLAIVSMSRQ